MTCPGSSIWWGQNSPQIPYRKDTGRSETEVTEVEVFIKMEDEAINEVKKQPLEAEKGRKWALPFELLEVIRCTDPLTPVL